jgi:membrane-associated phospholipid phosphatase
MRAQAHDLPASSASWRELAATPIVAAVTLVAALWATARAGVSFRDPDNVAAKYVLEVGAGVALLVFLDIWLRAARRTGTARPSRAALRAVRRERWTARRGVAVGTALVSFYVTYLAYRNLKGVIPFLRPGDLFDVELAEWDRALFFGHDPAVLLHSALGTGVTTHVLSTIYAAFIVFLPLSLGVALVFSRRLQVSLFYAAMLSINWVLGAVSYFLLPALGPVYVFRWTFEDLPHSEVTRLQQMLLDDRVGFLADPVTGTPQAIAAFASLHIAMSFSALLAAHVFRLSRRVKAALWAWMVLTAIATVYLGWHYVLDDVAGVVIGAVAFLLARALTGFDPRSVAVPAVTAHDPPPAARPRGAEVTYRRSR